MRTGQELYDFYVSFIKNENEGVYKGWILGLHDYELSLFMRKKAEMEPEFVCDDSGAIFLTEDMFKSGRPVAQGEVLIWMEKYAPQSVLNAVAGLKNLQPFKLENDAFIVGHSETGHHHVLEPVRGDAHISSVVQGLIDAANDTFMLLQAAEPFKLIHLRGTDTHDGFVFPPGEYIRGIREEQTVDGWRPVVD